VRTTQARARDSNAARAAQNGARRARGSAAGASDQEQAARQLADALEETLGAQVSVRARRGGGYRAELAFATHAEAIELLQRLGRRVPRARAPLQSARRGAISSVG
jgi:hypothetical protein